MELTVAPKRIKRYSSLQTVKNNAPPKPSYNLLEDLLSAGLIIGGAYLLGNALSSPSNAVAPSTTIINKINQIIILYMDLTTHLSGIDMARIVNAFNFHNFIFDFKL